MPYGLPLAETGILITISKYFYIPKTPTFLSQVNQPPLRGCQGTHFHCA